MCVPSGLNCVYPRADSDDINHWLFSSYPHFHTMTKKFCMPRTASTNKYNWRAVAHLFFTAKIKETYDNTFSLEYIQMKDVLGDALLSFRLLKVGGIIIFDDYWVGGVARATAIFEEAVGGSAQVLYRDKVGIRCCPPLLPFR